jgi:hypothetical protein
MTIKECAENVARQSLIVETMAMQNIACLDAEGQLQAKAEYEAAIALLSVWRERLLALMRETHGAMEQAAMNKSVADLMRLQRIH